MVITNEVASITVLVSFKRPGKEQTSEIVPFKVYQSENNFRAVPLLHAEERSFANLPEEMVFQFSNGSIKPIGDVELNQDVIRSIVQELNVQRLLS